MTCQETFIAQLRERGFRLTPQREMVLAVMHEIDGYATAEEILKRVQRLSSSVDISTVYRTLELLQAFDLVACVDPGDGQRRYELLAPGAPHLHLVCRSCGTVLDVGIEPFQPLADYLQAHYGFDVSLSHLSIPGLCQACRSARHQGP